MPIKIKNTTIAQDDLLGCSKWWGSPDLPQGVDYPRYTDCKGEEWEMQFICQINCADLSQYDTPLPKEGLLLFFANIDYYLGYDAEPNGEGVWDAGETKVIYVAPQEFDLLQQHILVDEEDNPIAIPCRQIEFEFINEDTGTGGNKLFGAPDFMPWEDWDKPCNGWKLLLQVDSQEDDDYILRFMDEGAMYFLIHPDDLAKGDFTKVRGAMVSM